MVNGVVIKVQAKSVPYVDPTRCQACRRCPARQVCKSKALTQVDLGEPPFVDASRCYGCHACVVECPFGAIIIPR